MKHPSARALAAPEGSPDSREGARLACLHSLGILDTCPDEALDNVTRTIASYFDVPITLISLVDRDRQWFKSKIGLDIAETSRQVSFCQHTIQGPGLFVVPDACADARFRANGLVTGSPFVRFYAGAPLHTSQGHRIGSLCLIDRKARRMDASDQALLVHFAALASAIIEDLYENRDIAGRLTAALQETCDLG